MYTFCLLSFNRLGSGKHRCCESRRSEKHNDIAHSYLADQITTNGDLVCCRVVVWYGSSIASLQCFSMKIMGGNATDLKDSRKPAGKGEEGPEPDAECLDTLLPAVSA